MKILFFTHCFLPDIGGVELSVCRTATALVRMGHHVRVMTETAKSRPEDDSAFDFEVDRFSVKKSWPLTRLKYWHRMWSMRKELSEYQVFHFHDYGTFIHWFFPMKFLFRRQVYATTFHGFDSWPIRLRDRFLRFVTASCMDCTFGVGAYLRRYYHHRIDSIVYGAPLRRPSHATTTGGVDFLYVGRMEEDTGIRACIETLREAADEAGANITLSLIGDGGSLKDFIVPDSRLRIVAHGAKLDIERYLEETRCVIVTGYLALFDAFSFDKVVIIPALNELKRAYFQSISSIEQMAWVATSTAELRAIFHAHLSSEASGEDERKIIRARDFARNLQWETVANQYVQSYRDAHTRHAE